MRDIYNGGTPQKRGPATTASFAAIWDLDGTLVNTEQAHFESWRSLLHEYGRDLDYAEFRPTFGRRNDDVLTHHFGFDPNDVDIDALGRRKESFFLADLEKNGVRCQLGAEELVNHFSKLGFSQAIASSAPRENIDFIVRRLPFSSTFEAIVSAEEIRHGKPAPDIVLKAAEGLNVPVSRAVVLEDAPAGVASGKSAGAKVLAIEAAFNRELLQQADLIVKSFEEVLWPFGEWVSFIESRKELGSPGNLAGGEASGEDERERTDTQAPMLPLRL